MPIIGVIASSNQTIKLSNFYSIATTTVGGAGSAYVEFANIPQTYTHLQIRAIGRTTTGSTNPDNTNLTMNSDTGSNYSEHNMNANGDGTAYRSGTANTTSINVGGFLRNGNLANAFGYFILDIYDYTNTNKNKTITSIFGNNTNTTSTNQVGIASGVWRSNSAVTTIRFTPALNTFNQYTTFALYGVL